MSEPELQFFNRGNKADYVLGTLEGWNAFDVVHWRAVEEISMPFQFEITAVRAAAQGEADLPALIETGATFRIATEGRFRPVHGIIAEAEELDRTTELFAYRFLLVPHVWVLRYRRACRTFRRKSIGDIITMVLENQVPGSPSEGRCLRRYAQALPPSDPNPPFDVEFKEPTGLFRLSLDEPARVFDDQRRTHLVQYNESDLDFLSRLFEEEGLSYFFEHSSDALVMTITDRVGHDPLFPRDEKHTLRSVSRGGSTRNQEVIRSLRSPQRMRSRSATIVDLSERTPLLPISGASSAAIPSPDRMRHYEFPGLFECSNTERAMPVASHRMERFDAERQLSDGTSTVRTLEPGRRCVITDGDQLRPDREVTIVRVETEARQLSTTFGDDVETDGATERPPFYRNNFTVLPTTVPFRPPPTAPKPRIYGIHQAIVTAEEFPAGAAPEINANELGAVRVRFPWDSRPLENGVPSSRWVSVSQYWAGVAYGALHTPRVGDFVLASFQDGDPERPVVIGRLYSEQMPPPYDPSKEPTRTTWKSHSSPKAEGSNELRFEDLAKHEEIYLHAQKDLNEVVLASHSTGVGGDQSNSVGGNRSHDVKGTESVTVKGDRTTKFLSNETTWSANTYFYPKGDFSVESTHASFKQSGSFTIHAGGCSLSMKQGVVTINNGAGASITLMGGAVRIYGGGGIFVTSGGLIQTIACGKLSLEASGDINATAPTIHLND